MTKKFYATLQKSITEGLSKHRTTSNLPHQTES